MLDLERSMPMKKRLVALLMVMVMLVNIGIIGSATDNNAVVESDVELNSFNYDFEYKWGATPVRLYTAFKFVEAGAILAMRCTNTTTSDGTFVSRKYNAKPYGKDTLDSTPRDISPDGYSYTFEYGSMYYMDISSTIEDGVYGAVGATGQVGNFYAIGTWEDMLRYRALLDEENSEIKDIELYKEK